jgi:2,3-bisphosphoglycerate-dependent phosphoglycerate mutase
MPGTLILIRHGESTWNVANLFTGWYDCPLSEKGVEEVTEAGRLLKESGIGMDVAFTSMLKRAITTLHIVLTEADKLWIPTTKAWELNERHYGGLTAMDKVETVEKHGAEQVLIWRRSYDIPPPSVDKSSPYHPSNDPRYSHLDFPEEFTETLKTTLDRVLPYYQKNIEPLLKEGKNVVIAAHGNSLRALVKHLDNISEDVIPNLNIPTGCPLVYEFDDDMNVVPSDQAMAPLRGRYLGNQEEIKARIDGVANQTSKKA